MEPIRSESGQAGPPVPNCNIVPSPVGLMGNDGGSPRVSWGPKMGKQQYETHSKTLESYMGGLGPVLAPLCAIMGRFRCLRGRSCAALTANVRGLALTRCNRGRAGATVGHDGASIYILAHGLRPREKRSSLGRNQKVR